MEEEDEIDVASADDAISQLSAIDAQLMDIRSDKNLTTDEKLTQMTNLLERRNKLVDKLQAAKSKEFKDFVDSLNLKDLSVQTFFLTSRKCRIGSENPEYELIEKPPQKKKLFSKSAPPHPLQQQTYEIIVNKKKEAEKELSKYSKKQILSPQDHAHKMRLEAEIQVYTQYLNQ